MPRSTDLQVADMPTPSRHGTPQADVPTFVYRFHNADGLLLYVGITLDPPTRWSNHGTDKVWWPEVADITAHRYPSRPDALIEEDRAIREERPVYNQVNSRARSRVRTGRGRGRPAIGPATTVRLTENAYVWLDSVAREHGLLDSYGEPLRGAAIRAVVEEAMTARKRRE